MRVLQSEGEVGAETRPGRGEEVRSAEIVQTSEKPGEERNRDTAGKYSRDDFLGMRRLVRLVRKPCPQGTAIFPGFLLLSPSSQGNEGKSTDYEEQGRTTKTKTSKMPTSQQLRREDCLQQARVGSRLCGWVHAGCTAQGREKSMSNSTPNR